MLRIIAGLLILMPCVVPAQDDFGAIGHFAADNAALGAPGEGELRVVFLGDSITQGWSDASPDFFAGHAYIERGIGGQTTPQMLLRFRSDVVALEPAAVVILAGTNDIAGNTGPATNEMIQQNIASMAEIATANNIRVILASILPADDYPWRPGLEPAQRIVAINQWLKDYAEANDHVYLDYHARMVNEVGGMQQRFTTDGAHVSVAGYAVMEVLADAAIDEALNQSREPQTDSGPVSDSNPIRFTPIDGCAQTTGSRRPTGQGCN